MSIPMTDYVQSKSGRSGNESEIRINRRSIDGSGQDESNDDLLHGPHIGNAMSSGIADHPPDSDQQTRDKETSRWTSAQQEGFGHRRSQRRFWIPCEWWREILASILSVASLLALVATLYTYDGNPSPKWPDYISLNTIVAIYATLTKAGIVFVACAGIGQLKWSYFATDFRPLSVLATYDEATRGVLGSFQLIWKLKWAHLLSSLGGIITILAVALDPFQQELLHYETCSITTAGLSASIPRANDYEQVKGNHIGAGIYAITTGMESALIGGLFNPSPYPQVDCSTGNCTWPDMYSTVAWCSLCEDLSDQLQFGNVTYQTGDLTTWNLTTTLPDSIQLNNTHDFLLQEYAAMGLSPDAEALDFVLAKTSSPLPFSAISNGSLAECADPALNNTLWTCKGYGAARCSISPCVKSFRASINAGIIRETLVETSQAWGNASGSVLQTAMLDTQCLNGAEKTNLTKLGYNIDASGKWMPYNLTFDYPIDPTQQHNFPQTMAARGCVYVMDLGLNGGLEANLDINFDGTVLGEVSDGTMVGFAGNPLVRSLFNYGNVTFARVNETFYNISTSLTNNVRQTALTNTSTPALGTVQKSETCVDIRWPWLSYSAVLVALTLVYLLLLMFVSHGAQLQTRGWKSSILPLLFHGLNPEYKKNVDDGQLDLRDPQTMKAFADKMAVKVGDVTARKLYLESAWE